jgi:restriction system protein
MRSYFTKREEIVAELFRKEGFEVELTQATRDKGIDIIAVSRRMNIPHKMIVECKRYAPENRVGIAVVQRLLGVKTEINANKAVVVTTSSFSKDAETVARERFWDLDLKAYTDVVAWLRDAVVSCTFNSWGSLLRPSNTKLVLTMPARHRSEPSPSSI